MDPVLDPDNTARRLRALTRIRKLLRLAEDQAGQPEGRTAMQQAELLMARYGLSRATFSTQGDDVSYRQRTFVVGKSEAWRQTLVHAVADYFDCVALHQHASQEVETYGPQGSLPQVEYTFIVYMRTLRDVWKSHAADLQDQGIWSALSKRQQLDARQAFCVSFVLGVQERLASDRSKEEREDPVSYREGQKQRKDLDRWMRRGGVRWRSSPNGVGTFSDEGYRAGLEAQVDRALKGAGGPRRLEG